MTLFCRAGIRLWNGVSAQRPVRQRGRGFVWKMGSARIRDSVFSRDPLRPGRMSLTRVQGHRRRDIAWVLPSVGKPSRGHDIAAWHLMLQNTCTVVWYLIRYYRDARKGALTEGKLRWSSTAQKTWRRQQSDVVRAIACCHCQASRVQVATAASAVEGRPQIARYSPGAL